MAYPSVTYTFSNSTTADATAVNQNFTDLINGLSDGTKDLSISALTVAGTATLNGAVNLGNATSDDLTITGYLASSFIPKTNQTYDIGTADLGLRALYLGVASAGALTAKVIASASIAADRIFTIPEAGTDASFVMTAGTQTVSGAKTFDTAGNLMKGITSGSSIGAGYIGEKLTSAGSATAWSSGTYTDGGNSGLAVTAGVWLIKASVLWVTTSDGSITKIGPLGVGTVSGNDSTGLDITDYLSFSMASHTPSGNTVLSSFGLYVNISGSTTYYPKMNITGTRGSGTVTNYLTAIRIA